MDSIVKDYLSNIGRLGGMRSRRKLTPTQARTMVSVREAKRAFKKYYASCFWSYDPNYQIGINDVAWVAEQLRLHGNRTAWLKASELLRRSD